MVAEIADIRRPVDADRLQNGAMSVADGLSVDLKQEDVIDVSSEDEDYCYSNSLALHGSQDENAAPSFGTIAVSNSSGIHVGNKNYYQGPVTIKKIIYAGAGGGAEADANDVQNGGPIANGKWDKDKDNSGAGANGAIEEHKADKGSQPENSFRSLVKKLSYNKPLLITIIVCSVAIIGLTSLLLLFLRDNGMEHPPKSDDQPTPAHPIDPVELPPDKLRIVSRREWLAKDPSGQLDALQLPVPYVIIMHTATENCTDTTSCAYFVKQIQSFHMNSRNWEDIGYNFLVGGDGYAYEGRGWSAVGAHTLYYNDRSIGIAFVGTFNDYLPPKRQLDAAKKLIALGVNNSYLQEDYKLFGARQLTSTQSPGLMLYNEIKTWPHWAAQP